MYHLVKFYFFGHRRIYSRQIIIESHFVSSLVLNIAIIRLDSQQHSLKPSWGLAQVFVLDVLQRFVDKKRVFRKYIFGTSPLRRSLPMFA